MNNVDLDINLFNDLKYSLLMHGEVKVDAAFDSHMYADTKRVITLGVGFNVEELDKIQYICALKLAAFKPLSDIENSNGDFSSFLNDTNKLEAINFIASAVSTCIQTVKHNGDYGIQSEDKQIPDIDTQLITIEELERSFTDSSHPITNSRQRAEQNRQTTANTAAYGPLSHRRALMLELSVNRAIEDAVNNLNDTTYKNNKLNAFNFTLTKEEAVEIFSILSMSFYKGLIRSLKTGHSKNIFPSSFALHSKLILSFLSNYYQMPDKFNTYNDPQAYFSNAVSKNNSRFLTWFGIRYYIDLVSATVDNQYTLYRKRRIHEAALFELIERDADGNIDIFNSALDIFNYLNIEMLVVHTSNRPLKNYGTGYSYLKFIEQHPHCKSIDTAANDENLIKLSTYSEYICFLNTTTKISDILPLLQDSSTIKTDDYVQEVLDFASCHKIFQPFLVYMNEKFSKEIVDIDYKLDEIFVINSSNNSKFRNSLISKISEKSNAERIEILIISLMEYNQHQRFYDILSSYDNICITFYVLQGKNHTLTVENMTETNFKIILYTKTSEINAVNISGEYIYEREEASYFYKHKDNDKLEAEYILSENKLIIRYDKTTTVTLLNYIPSNNHCGIILSNKDTVNPEPKTVSQSGEMSVKVNFSASSIFDFNCIDKKKYYLYNVETGEIIDTFVELQGNEASASFKLNMESGMLSNTKCIFSFFYEDICSLRLANFLSHDMCLINQLDKEAKQVEVTAKINEKEVPQGVVTGIELVSPSSDNLPEQSDFMSTEYKLKAITKDVEDSSQVKWCYAVLTDSEYRGKIKVSQVSESLSQTGEEIAFKPENILSESSKKKLSNKDVSAKLYIFAYMKSPAYYTKHGQTHVKCGIKKDLSNIQISDKDWHDPLEKMEICLFSESGHYKPWYSSFSATTRDIVHQGIDLYARVGTPVYACMDGEIISTKSQHNVGTVILKVTGKQVEILRKMEKKDYQNILHKEIKTENYSDDNLNFKYDSDIFVFRYMHLDEVYITNKYVKCGQIIGRSGIKSPKGGIYKDSHNPHLHFEISSSDAMKTGLTGLKYRINPRVYINYKMPDMDLSSEYILSVSTCKEYFKSAAGNNAYLNNAYEEFREQVECMLNPEPYRIKQK